MSEVENIITLRKGVSDELVSLANSDKYIDGFISDKQTCYSIIVNGKESGLIDLQRMNGYTKVSTIYVKPEFQQMGLAKFALDKLKDIPTFAFVDKNNYKSNKLFSSSGYELDGQREKDGTIYNLYIRNKVK
jgi:ribosomal protein S18 acetylase RimI-like enzyme